MISAIVPVLAWLPVIAIKVVLVLLGLLAYVYWRLTGHMPELYKPSRDIWTFNEIVVRNPADGLKYLVKPPVSWYEATNSNGMEQHDLRRQGKRVAYRWRRKGLMASLRCTWIWSEKKGGECYIGWKLGSEKGALDFALSLRPYVDE